MKKRTLKWYLKKYYLYAIFFLAILGVVWLGVEITKFIGNQLLWELDLIANGLCC